MLNVHGSFYETEFARLHVCFQFQLCKIELEWLANGIFGWEFAFVWPCIWQIAVKNYSLALLYIKKNEVENFNRCEPFSGNGDKLLN